MLVLVKIREITPVGQIFQLAYVCTNKVIYNLVTSNLMFFVTRKIKMLITNINTRSLSTIGPRRDPCGTPFMA